MQEEKLARMKELDELLDRASRAYYQEAREIMSDHEYDALYEELTALEAETGIRLSGSPTQKVGYQVLSELPKVRHDRPMLSLDKTKSREALREWIGEYEGILSWKLDGLTVVMTYENGELVQAVTRGNGEVGEQITENARTFYGLPLHIPYKGRLVIRGEAVISYKDFEKTIRVTINRGAPKIDLNDSDILKRLKEDYETCVRRTGIAWIEIITLCICSVNFMFPRRQTERHSPMFSTA